jgi:excisionase family DNA binding protein
MNGSIDAGQEQAQQKPRQRKVSQPLIRRLLSREEVAECLGISTWKVDDMIEKGELPHVSIGRRKLVDIQDLDEWIEKHKEGGNGQSLQTEELENLVDKILRQRQGHQRKHRNRKRDRGRQNP